MRYYNKKWFFVKHIECDSEFKYIIDEVINDMRIETNHENAYKKVTGLDSNNRVIKETFRIAHYRFPYKKIPKIMIRTLNMNLTRNLNLVCAKGGVPAHYILHMIL